MDIVVVRHCKAEGQSPGANLTEEGAAQARRLAEFLRDKPIQRIYSSPYVRAMDSIAPFARRNQVEVIPDERLQERVLSGEDHPDWREMLRNTFDDPNLCYEGGESSAAAAERILSVVRDVRESGLNTVAIVTHGNLMSLLLRHYDDRYGFEAWASLSNPDVYHIRLTGQAPAVTRIWS